MFVAVFVGVIDWLGGGVSDEVILGVGVIVGVTVGVGVSLDD